jgi:DUF4097 and DUF4098 domain-containing protein YvlB
VTAPVHVSVSNRSGRITVRAVEGAALSARDATTTESPDGTIEIRPTRGPSAAVEIVCPTGSDLTVGTASGRVELRGALGAVRVVSGSGRVEVERAVSADVRTASGRVVIGRCEVACRVVTSSGRVEIDHAPEVEVSTSSGRIDAGGVHRAVVTSVDGRVTVGASGPRPDVRVRTVSGRVGITVDGSSRPAVAVATVTGSVRRQFTDGADGSIEVSTTSGSVDLGVRGPGR